MGDQPLIADALTRSGLGYAVQPEELTLDWRRDSLDRLLTGDGLCLGTLKKAAHCYDAVQVSVDLIENLLPGF